MIKYQCPICHKEIELSLSNIGKYPKTYFYIVGTYDCKEKRVCSQECLNKYEKSLICETYKGYNIYKIGDRYIPYLGCDYYYDSVDGVRERIDNPSMIPVTPRMMIWLTAIARGEI